jgi:ADP-heptose:LPS heptosyltransferase
MNMQLKPAPLKIDKPARILVDRRKAIGDLLMITPVLRELRSRYGADAFIQVVTEEIIVLENNPHIDCVVAPTDMRQEDPWDYYLNLNDAYEQNVTSHYVDAYLYRAFGANIDSIDRTLVLTTTREEQETVDDVIAQMDSDYIVVHMRRWAWENKNIDPLVWTMLFTWIEASQPNLKIVSVGAQHDMKAPVSAGSRYVDLVDQLSLGEIRHLIANAKCFIGGDSGPYHIAATTDTPIIALLSHLAPEQILPWRDGEFGKNVHVVQSSVACVGCYARQTPPVRQLTCENAEQWACSKAFDFNKISEVVNNIINEGKHE